MFVTHYCCDCFEFCISSFSSFSSLYQMIFTEIAAREKGTANGIRLESREAKKKREEKSYTKYCQYYSFIHALNSADYFGKESCDARRCDRNEIQ